MAKNEQQDQWTEYPHTFTPHEAGGWFDYEAMPSADMDALVGKTNSTPWRGNPPRSVRIAGLRVDANTWRGTVTCTARIEPTKHGHLATDADLVDFNDLPIGEML